MPLTMHLVIWLKFWNVQGYAHQYLTSDGEDSYELGSNEGNWKQMKGKVQQKWGKLTDDDFDVIDGKREEMAGKIQERYGIEKEEAEKEIDDFCNKC